MNTNAAVLYLEGNLFFATLEMLAQSVLGRERRLTQWTADRSLIQLCVTGTVQALSAPIPVLRRFLASV